MNSQSLVFLENNAPNKSGIVLHKRTKPGNKAPARERRQVIS